METKVFPSQSFDAIAFMRTGNLALGDGQAQARTRHIPCARHGHQKAAVNALAGLENPSIIRCLG